MVSVKKKIKFGILGCGMIAGVHADAISRIENAELVGVADSNYDFAINFAKKLNVKAFNGYEDMLSSDIDAVCICTPSCFHAQNAIYALDSGKHVVVEKPMALSSKDADLVIEKAKEKNRLVTVISQLRFSDDIVNVKKHIENGDFGTITLAELDMKYYRSPEYYSSSPWKGTLKFDGGGALMNQGIHGVDLLQYVMGGVKKVVGATKTLVHNVEVEDTAVAIVEFNNGALGTIVASSCAYPGFERKIKIQGSKGYVILSENKIEKIMIDGVESENIGGDKSVTSHDASKLSSDYHYLQLKNFLCAINNEEKLFIDATEGKKAVEIIEKIYIKNALM